MDGGDRRRDGPRGAAASLTGLARHTIRTVGRLTGNPQLAARLVDESLEARAELLLCSAIILVLPDTPEEPARLPILVAGHPPAPSAARPGRSMRSARVARSSGRPTSTSGSWARWIGSWRPTHPLHGRRDRGSWRRATGSESSGSVKASRERPTPAPRWRRSNPPLTRSSPASPRTTLRYWPSCARGLRSAVRPGWARWRPDRRRRPRRRGGFGDREKG